MNLFGNIILSSVSIGIAYLAYLFFIRNKTGFKTMRLFLLSSVIISLFLPLVCNSLNLTIRISEKAQQIEADQFKSDGNIIFTFDTNSGSFLEKEKTKNIIVNWKAVFSKIYLTGFLFLITFQIAQVLLMGIKIFRSNKKRFRNCILVHHNKTGPPFSFFRWVFIDANITEDESFEAILEHERIHVTQLHSLDIVLIELISAAMWFNPFIWMMRKSVKLIHEYLADEGALNTGIDKLRYQTLLINQITQERLIPLSSSFHPASRQGRHSLIKKRMIMMTKNKINRGSRLKILTILPATAIMFFAVAGIRGAFPELAKAEEKPNISSEKIIHDNLVEEGLANMGQSEIKNNQDDDTLKYITVVGYGKSRSDTTSYEKSDTNSYNEIEVIGYGKRLNDTTASERPDNRTHGEIEVIGYGRMKNDATRIDKSDAKSYEEIEVIGYGQGDTTAQKGSMFLQFFNRDTINIHRIYYVDSVEVENIDDVDVNDVHRIDVMKDEDQAKVFILTKNYRYITSEEEEIFIHAEEMPSFRGGDISGFQEYLMAQIKYPEDAKSSGVKGVVHVKFVIDEKGNLIHAGIVHGLSKSVDDEILRVLKASPKWSPGRQNGKNVKVLYDFPVVFETER